MKTKVTQKEWNDKRDAFLCAFAIRYTSVHWIKDACNAANALTAELYEVEEEKPVQQYEKAMFMGQEVENLNRPIKAEDTRPFNPKVVEIFNEFLPKEIAPLAIEAHKRSCEIDKTYLDYGVTLEDCLMMSIKWLSTKKIGHFQSLYRRAKWNTITATPEQLREWFPQAYEGGTND
jgi:hypothetical protein